MSTGRSRAEVAYAEVGVVLGLLHAGDLGAGPHAGLETGSDHPAFRRADIVTIALAGAPDAHRVVGGPPLHHVDAGDGEQVVEALDRGLLLDHDRDHDVPERLHVAGCAAVLGRARRRAPTPKSPPSSGVWA